jgi:transcriptional regulator GlxA family with amidase domain
VDAVLSRISQDIRRDPGRRWSVAELAERAALSRAQFTRRFTAHTGLPPARYMINARVDRARQLLADTTMSVTRIAAALGYPDVASFSRQYRQVTGSPPGRAR